MNTTQDAPVSKPVWHGIIVATPGTCGGKPRIDGTRIRVQDIYQWHEVTGRSIDEIISDFPHLTHAGIYAALSYYWDHREAMHAMMQEEEELVNKLMSIQEKSTLKQL